MCSMHSRGAASQHDGYCVAARWIAALKCLRSARRENLGACDDGLAQNEKWIFGCGAMRNGNRRTTACRVERESSAVRRMWGVGVSRSPPRKRGSSSFPKAGFPLARESRSQIEWLSSSALDPRFRGGERGEEYAHARTIHSASWPGLSSQVGYIRLATRCYAEVGQARLPVPSTTSIRVTPVRRGCPAHRRAKARRPSDGDGRA